MKKTKLLSLVLAGALTLGLVGCGGSTEKKEDDKTIKIGVTSVPHEEIVNAIKPLIEEKGYTLDITSHLMIMIHKTQLFMKQNSRCKLFPTYCIFK